MPNALQHVAWEPCLIEPSRDRALESYARRRQGILKGIAEPVVTYAVREVLSEGEA
jgi:hypothetical protein